MSAAHCQRWRVKPSRKSGTLPACRWVRNVVNRSWTRSQMIVYNFVAGPALLRTPATPTRYP